MGLVVFRRIINANKDGNKALVDLFGAWFGVFSGDGLGVSGEQCFLLCLVVVVLDGWLLTC